MSDKVLVEARNQSPASLTRSCGVPAGPQECLLPDCAASLDRRLRCMVDHVEVVFHYTLDGLLTFVNPEWTDLTGFAVEETIGKSFLDFVWPEDRERVMRGYREGIDLGKHISQLELRVRTAGGHPLWVLAFSRRLYDESGRVVASVGRLFDIHSRKQAEAEAHLAHRLAQARADLFQALLTEPDVVRALEASTRVMRRGFDVDVVRIWLLDPADRKLVLRASAGAPEVADACGSEIALDSPQGRIILESRGRSLDRELLNAAGDRLEWVRRLGMDHVAGLPLVVEARPSGLIVFFSRTEIPPPCARGDGVRCAEARSGSSAKTRRG